MLQRCLVSFSSHLGENIDVGSICEAMVFYKNTIITCDIAGVSAVVRYFGANNFLTLLNNNDICLVLYDGTNAIPNGDLENGLPVYRTMTVSLVGHEKNRFPTIEEKLQNFLSSTIVNRSERNIFINKLLERVELSNYRADIFNNIPPWDLIGPKMFEREFLEPAFRDILDEISDGRMNLDRFFVIPKRTQTGKLLISTGDLSKAKEYLPPNIANDFKMANMLLIINDALEEIKASEHYSASIISGRFTRRLSRLYYNEMWKKLNKEQNDIQSFSEVVLENSAAVREAIESGERSISDLLRLLEKMSVVRLIGTGFRLG